MNKKKVSLIVVGVILILIIGSYFLFKNNIKAYSNELKAKKLGINVKYLENPLYCEVDSDCIIEVGSCGGSVNKYNYNYYKGGSCEAFFYGPYCENNNCKMENRPKCESKIDCAHYYAYSCKDEIVNNINNLSEICKKSLENFDCVDNFCELEVGGFKE